MNLRRSSLQPKTKLVFDFKKVDQKALQSEFASAPWHICNIFDDIDDATWAWETLYKYIVNHHIPCRKAKIRSTSLPWMTSSLRKELNKRYNVLLKAQKSPKGSHQWAAYKKQRNYCTKLLRSAELQYWNNKFTSFNSSKEFWKLINSFQGNLKSNTIGLLKDSSGSLLTNNFSKANELNSYFTNVFSTLANTRDIHMQDHSIKSGSHIYRVTPTFSNFIVSRDIISHCLKKHQSGKSLWSWQY